MGCGACAGPAAPGGDDEAEAAGESWPHRCRFVVANFGVQDISVAAGAT